MSLPDAASLLWPAVAIVAFACILVWVGLGCRWVRRHPDPEPCDLDPETEARIWANVQAAINEDRSGR